MARRVRDKKEDVKPAELLNMLRKRVARAESRHGDLVAHAFSIIRNPEVEDSVRAKLIIGLMNLVYPKYKTVDVDVQTTPVEVIFKTNVKAIDGDTISRPSNVIELPQ